MVWCQGGDADTHALLAKEAPGAVGMAVKKEPLAPMHATVAGCIRRGAG
jgi:hypothetical protein